MRLLERFRAWRATAAVDGSLRQLLATQDLESYWQAAEANRQRENYERQKLLDSLTPKARVLYLLGMEKVQLQKEQQSYRPLWPYTD